MCWENQAAGAKLNNKAIRATAPAADRRPWLIPNALGPGLHAVDFSVTGDTTKDGRYLRLSTDTFVGDYSETAVEHQTSSIKHQTSPSLSDEEKAKLLQEVEAQQADFGIQK